MHACKNIWGPDTSKAAVKIQQPYYIHMYIILTLIYYYCSPITLYCYFFDRYTQSNPPPPTIIFSCSYLLLYLMITNSLNGISSVSNKYTEFNFFLQLQTQKCVPNVVGSGDTITIYVCLDSEFARFESLNVFNFYLCTNNSFQK